MNTEGKGSKTSDIKVREKINIFLRLSISASNLKSAGCSVKYENLAHKTCNAINTNQC